MRLLFICWWITNQTFSIVDDQGFKEIAGKLDPLCHLDRFLKNMVQEMYEEEKTKTPLQSV